MGFSPKILVALIVLGLVATGSIVFNVYLLATKDKTLELLKTEVESLKDSKTKLESELKNKSAENNQPDNKLKSGAGKTLSVNLEGNTITLEEVDLDGTVEAVKHKIQEKKGIPQGVQLLSFNGEQLEDNLTLSECKIQNESTLDLGIKPSFRSESTSQPSTTGGEKSILMEIYVMTRTGKITTLKVESKDTIQNVKQKYWEIEKIPSDIQRLIFNGKELVDDLTLSNYGIKKKILCTWY